MNYLKAAKRAERKEMESGVVFRSVEGQRQVESFTRVPEPLIEICKHLVLPVLSDVLTCHACIFHREQRHLHSETSPPPEVSEIQGLIMVQKEEVLRQSPDGREVVHVDEGVSGDEALVILPGWPEHDGDRSQIQRIKEFLRDIVLVYGVLKGQVELTAGDDGSVVLLGNVLLEQVTVDVNVNVLAQLLVVLHPPVFRLVVANDPADQLLLIRRYEIQEVLKLGVEWNQRTVRHTDVGVFAVTERDVKQVVQAGDPGRVRRRLRIHPDPLLVGRPEKRWEV